MEEYKIEIGRMAYVTIDNGKLVFIKGEFKDTKGCSYSLEFYRYQLKFYLNEDSEFTGQVKEVFRYFVKMAEVFNPDMLEKVYNTLKANDSEMFKFLEQAMSEVEKELFSRYKVI